MGGGSEQGEGGSIPDVLVVQDLSPYGQPTYNGAAVEVKRGRER